MGYKRRAWVTPLYLFIDICAILLSFYTIYLARFRGPLALGELFQNESFLSHLYVAALMGLLLILFLYKNGLYTTKRGARFSEEFLGVLEAVFWALLLGIVFTFLFHKLVISRLVLLSHAALLFFLLFSWRFLKRKVLEKLVSEGYKRTTTLIVGAGRMGRYLARLLEGQKWLGIDVVGFLDDRYSPETSNNPGIAILGKVSDFNKVIKQTKIHNIYIINPSEREKVKALIDQAHEAGIGVNIVPETYDLLVREMEYDTIGSLTIARLFAPVLSRGQRFVKRFEDVVLSCLALLFLCPITAIVAVAIRLTSPGPVIFKQGRLGKNGNPFIFYKFRTMYAGAEKDSTEHKTYVKELIKNDKPVNEGQQVYKMADDKRITRVGKILRKYGFDEIPQLWNVLRGNMSLIGPRPPLPYEYEEYEEYHKKRLILKPGITGLWQVSGKSTLSFSDMILLDIRYINECSPWLDLRILLETIPLVLKGWGGER